MTILAIDPGDKDSAFCMMDSNYRPILFDKRENENILGVIRNADLLARPKMVVIERVASYGMPVGREVFDTCEWIGRFTEAALYEGMNVDYILRMDEKMTICHDSRAKDANIRQALIDRFAKHDRKNGKGTKKDPDVFFGFRADIWSAAAVAVTWLDKEAEKHGKA